MRILRWIAFGVLGLFATLLLLALVVLRFPGLVVNERTLELARDHLLPRLGVEARWREARVAASSSGLLDKRIELAFDGLSVRTPTVAFDAERAAAAADVALRPGGRWLPGLGPLMVAGGKLALSPAAEPARKEEGEPLDVHRVARFFDGRRLEPVDVELAQLSIAEKRGALTVSLRSLAERHFEIRGGMTGFGEQPLPSVQLQASVGLHEQGDRLTPSLEAQLGIVLPPPSRGVLEARLTLSPPRDEEGPGRRVSAAARIRAKGHALDARFDGRWRESDGRLVGSFAGKADEVAGRRIGLTLDDCALDARSDDYLAADVSLALACAGRSGVPVAVVRPELRGLLPKVVPFGLDTHVRLLQEEGPRRLDFGAGLRFDRVAAGPLVGDGTVRIDGRLRATAPGQPERLAADFDLGVELGELGDLVRRLAGTRLAVWAPLNQLRGGVACAAKGRVDLVREALHLPFECRTALRSVDQALVTSAEGRLRLTPHGGRLQPDLEATLELSDVRIVLPDVDLRSRKLPRVIPDQRIGRQIEQQGRRLLPARFDVRVRTLRPDALRLATRLVGAEIPVALNVRATHATGLQGDVTVGGFEATLFRRVAHVDHLRVVLEGSASPTLDGRVEFESNDYRVYLSIFGTAAAPRYVLRTDPPLPEQDVVAVLLFGRPPELLDEDTQRSSEQARAAIADSAISLMTMYWLASTPVESVGYNPYTGLVTAKVKLAEGLSLMVGRGDDESTIGLRRRIGRNWSIETQAVRMPGEDGSRGVAMLKWGKRY
jgi:hypothetical protein